MQAMFQDKYGSPDGLQQTEIDIPHVGDTQVLIRVHSAALHVGDCFAIRGTPYLVRMATGLLKPQYGVPGFDVAGWVVSVGKDVKRFQPGDEVFGECNGACAEYAVAEENKLASKPCNLSFEQAAAVPTSALAALHALRDTGSVRAGQRVLINGASGGVGTFAVQIAKSLGAEVTGVCSSKNLDMVRSIGADHVIDYTQADFAAAGPRYDLILDNVENRSLSDCRRALTPTGTLILNSGTGARGLAFMVRLVKPLLLSPWVKQRLCRYLSVPNHKDLVVLSQLLESGAVAPVISRTYPLSQTPEAIHYLESGHVVGKVIINLDATPPPAT